MIKFFRKIRYNLMSENKTGKYFKYAIGEILLVVIGILIALQINNWNENRKLNNNEKIILTDLVEDLELDYSAFTEDKKMLDKQLKLVDELIIDPHNSKLAKTDINFIRYLVYRATKARAFIALRIALYSRLITSKYRTVNNSRCTNFSGTFKRPSACPRTLASSVPTKASIVNTTALALSPIPIA